MTPKPKITLTWADLNTPAVDERVRQQSALASAQAASQKAAATPSRLPVPEEEEGSIWYNAFISLAIFGLIGGLLAWGCGELVQYLNPDERAEAMKLSMAIQDVVRAADQGRMHGNDAMRTIVFLERSGRNNAWFRLNNDKTLTEAQRTQRRQQLQTRERLRSLFGDICFYAVCGTMLAVSLGMAESIATRNFQGAVIYGAVGAALGLVGGVLVSLFIEKLYNHLKGSSEGGGVTGSQVMARAVAWGILGLFLSAAPGIVMRSGRKLIFGLIGGFVGGAIGGVLFDTVGKWVGNPVVSRLIAIVSIGVVTGVGTALVENVAKQGWLRVVKGLIAGKQFIVYRNPTFIGSSPHCEIYLFKDAKVGRRHAALHILKTGYHIEDLGTGSATYVNGHPVTRTRLRGGDHVQIGATCFTFQEKLRN
jgi:hypothetical protein